MDHVAIQEAVAAYALGAVDPDERAAVEAELLAHLPGCDDCLRMLRDYREVAGELAFAPPPVAPPPELEERIVRGLERRSEPQIRSRSRIASRALAVAAAVMLFASLGWNAVLMSRTNERGRDVQALQKVVALVSHPEAKRVPLRGRGGSLSLVFREGGSAALIGSQVEAPPAGRVLELWLLRDGKPTAVTVFRPERGSVLVPVDIDPAGFRGVAVTVEERLVPAPTTQPIYAGTIDS